MSNLLLVILLIVVAGTSLVAGAALLKLNQAKKDISSLTETANKERSSSSEKISLINKELAAAHDRLASLAKYSGLLEIEDEARRIKSSADEYLQNAHFQVDAITKDAISSANEEKAAAKTILDQARLNADTLKQEASFEAQGIVEAAKQQAEEIAGDALRARSKSREYERTAQAMKNIIDGYGDEYIVPTYSILDDLADEFGFAEAGQSFKRARENTKRLIKQGTAAACDYVEVNRRQTAIQFVLDAFNGKVDTILSRSKSDNFGILQQKIVDAFQLVNHLGTAFRNAVITSEYLEARMNELKWACIVQELKDQEREEQRRIREQIREEEKALKEAAKAIAEAEKEEAFLQKAMEKIRLHIDSATAEQKAQYEEQLRDLEQKLEEAEAKNQRALSMAQQTKAGHVYIISNIGSFGEDVFKIGMTRRLEPRERVQELGDASVPFPFDIHAMIYSEDAPKLEGSLHKIFSRQQINKINPRKEFFRTGLTDIRREIDGMGINANWTIRAEAREYRETLVIEKTLDNKIEQKFGNDRHLSEITLFSRDNAQYVPDSQEATLQ